MDIPSFHFSEPLWLWALIVPPLVLFWLRRSVPQADESDLRRYADPHLLSHLTRKALGGGTRGWKKPLWWAAIWSLAALAMAGPRWDYAVQRLFRPGADLIVLLDISRSMETADVTPSRLARSRQEISDLLELEPTLRVGLIVFASVSYVVVPITEDRDAIKRVLPEVTGDLVRLQGSRLSAALERAERLFAGQPDGSTHAMLLISDGDLVEPGLEEQVRGLAQKGIRLHVLGMGSPAGGLVPGLHGNPLRDRAGVPVHSRLQEGQLQKLATAGEGLYSRADFRDDDVRAVVEHVVALASLQETEGRDLRIWHERYYWLAVLAMLLLLPWFRRARVPDVQLNRRGAGGGG